MVRALQAEANRCHGPYPYIYTLKIARRERACVPPLQWQQSPLPHTSTPELNGRPGRPAWRLWAASLTALPPTAGLSKFEQAVRLYTEALELDRDHAVLYSNRSASYLAMKEFDKALADGRTAVAHRGDWARAHYRCGAALQALQQVEESRAAFTRCLELDPADEAARLNLFLLTYGEGADAAAPAAVLESAGSVPAEPEAKAAAPDSRVDSLHDAFTSSVSGAPCQRVGCCPCAGWPLLSSPPLCPQELQKLPRSSKRAQLA